MIALQESSISSSSDEGEDDIDRRTRSVIYRQASRTISKAHLPSGGAEEDYADWVDVGDGVHKLLLEVNLALIIWTNVCLEEWEERAVWVDGKWDTRQTVGNYHV